MWVLNKKFWEFGITPDGSIPDVWTLHNSDQYEYVDFAVNTNGSLVAVYGTKRNEARGFIHIVDLDTFETVSEIEQEEFF